MLIVYIYDIGNTSQCAIHSELPRMELIIINKILTIKNYNKSSKP